MISLRKNLRAAEQERPDVARARRRWMRERLMFNPARLVFIDETPTSGGESTCAVPSAGDCSRAAWHVDLEGGFQRHRRCRHHHAVRNPRKRTELVAPRFWDPHPSNCLSSTARPAQSSWRALASRKHSPQTRLSASWSDRAVTKRSARLTAECVRQVTEPAVLYALMSANSCLSIPGAPPRAARPVPRERPVGWSGPATPQGVRRSPSCMGAAANIPVQPLVRVLLSSPTISALPVSAADRLPPHPFW